MACKCFRGLCYTCNVVWTRRRFRLTKQILGIRIVNGERVARYIPEGETVVVLRGPRPDAMRLVDVAWDGQEFAVFAVDLQERGDELRSAETS